MNKKLVIAVCAVAALTFGAYARPHGGPGGGAPRGPAPMHHGGGFGHRPPPAPRHHHSAWGRGGCNFWPGFIGGVVGGAVVSSVVTPAPVVVAAAPAVTTVTTTQSVWIDGRYIDQVQPNGVVVRTWQPGHYEQRVITY